MYAIHIVKILVRRYFLTPWWRKRFNSFGDNSIINCPLHITCPQNIIIGNSVVVGYKTWLAAEPCTGYQSNLTIEDGCRIGNFNHIYATRQIIIGKSVLTADKVYITDNTHGYEDVNTPILKQPIVQRNIVKIGEGAWLGENVCVIGANIGKHCVIGANSVVTKDIPDYSVAVGAPAKIIKTFDFNENTWKKVDHSVVITENLGGGRICYYVQAA